MTSNDARDSSNNSCPGPAASTASVDTERTLVMAEDISRAQHMADIDGTLRRRVRARGRQYTDFRNLRICENGGGGGTVYRYGTSGDHAEPPLLGYFSRDLQYVEQ